MAKEKKQKKSSKAIHGETKSGFGDKKLEGPNRPAE